MNTARVILSIAFALVATVAVLFALTSLDTSAVQRTIENSRKIDASLKEAAAFVDEHVAREGRLPTPESFEAWANGFPSRPYTVNGIRLDPPPYPTEFIGKHGQPPKNGYVLTYWRGEWEEIYVSWSKRTSMVFEPSAYFMFGNSLAQAAIGGASALFLGIFAFKIWPRQRNAA